MIPVWLTAFFTKVPKWVWLVLGALLVFGLLTEAVIFYGDQREKYGAATERAAWVEKYNRAVIARNRAQTELTRVQGERDRAIAERDAARNTAVTHTITEIHNAPNLTAAYAAYANLRDSLRNQSASRRSRAWADLSASINAAPS